MRRSVAAPLCAALLLLLCACDTGPGLSLRLFCERYTAHGRGGSETLAVTQFFAEPQCEGGNLKYAAYSGSGYITCEALKNGRLHTVSLTAPPDGTQSGFSAASLCLVKAFTKLPADETERIFGELGVGQMPVLGLRMLERGGFRFCYAANEAGRYLRVSSLRELPPERELATLREFITER